VVTPRTILLTIMAHPDDAELWAGGTILRHINDGGTATIAVARHDQARDAEAAQGARALGADLYMMDDRTPDTISTVLADVRPEMVITHPTNDIHPHHQQCAHAVLEALPASVISTGHPRRVYHCDGYNNLDQLGRPLELSHIIDVSEYWPAKIAALRAHVPAHRRSLRANGGSARRPARTPHRRSSRRSVQAAPSPGKAPFNPSSLTKRRGRDALPTAVLIVEQLDQLSRTLKTFVLGCRTDVFEVLVRTGRPLRGALVVELLPVPPPEGIALSARVHIVHRRSLGRGGRRHPARSRPARRCAVLATDAGRGPRRLQRQPRRGGRTGIWVNTRASTMPSS
jgi:N-acetylglucosamine malate deacetylase 1